MSPAFKTDSGVIGDGAGPEEVNVQIGISAGPGNGQRLRSRNRCNRTIVCPCEDGRNGDVDLESADVLAAVSVVYGVGSRTEVERLSGLAGKGNSATESGEEGTRCPCQLGYRLGSIRSIHIDHRAGIEAARDDRSRRG